MDKTEATLVAYTHNAKAYADKFMDFEPYTQQIMEFAKLLDPGAKVLDLGCGPGNVAKHLYREKAVSITGVDLSDEMVDMARKNVPGTFFTQDIRNIDFFPESFTAVVLSFCLVHLSYEEATQLLAKAAGWLVSVLRTVRQGYHELDGSITTDVFIFARKR